MTERTGPTMEKIPEQECRDLLAGSTVGRLGFVSHGKPLILPVNHALDGGDIVFRTKRGSKLDAARRESGTPVVYEVDDYDAEAQRGWSVIVKGSLEPVLDLTEQTRLDNLGLVSWADDPDRREWLRVNVEEISGRRVVPRG